MATRQFETPNLALVNAEGEASYTPKHEFKLLGSYQIPKIETSVNAFFRATSGLPYNRIQQFPTSIVGTGSSTTYRRILIDPRGTYHLPTLSQLDLRIEKNFTFAGQQPDRHLRGPREHGQPRHHHQRGHAPTSVTLPDGSTFPLPFDTPAAVQSPRQIRIGAPVVVLAEQRQLSAFRPERSRALPDGAASASGPPGRPRRTSAFASGDMLESVRGQAPDKPSPPTRTEPREIIELRQLKEDQPDLASAIDLQIQLLQMQRRVQSRVPLPSMNLDAAHLDKVLAAGKPILAFEQVPIDWSDLRFLVRSTADAMRTHEAIETDDYRRVEALSRDAEQLRAGDPQLVRGGAAGARRRPRAVAGDRRARAAAAAGDAAVPVALRRRDHGAHDCSRAGRTATARSAAASPTSRSSRRRPSGCSSAPAARRAGASISSPARCASTPTARRSRRSPRRDGLYRLNGCDVCQRYVKAFDGRNAHRQVMPVGRRDRDAAARRGGRAARLSVVSSARGFSSASDNKKGPARKRRSL